MKYYIWLTVSVLVNAAIFIFCTKYLQKTGSPGRSSTISSPLSVASESTICMMMPVTSRGILFDVRSGLKVTDLPLTSKFLPSFFNTIEKNYQYRIYVAYDYGDLWFDNYANLEELFAFFKKMKSDSVALSFSVELKTIILYGIDRRITAIWNTIANKAYKDGCDYFYPANDDFLIITDKWTSAAISALKACSVAPNFGIAVFRDISSCMYPTFHLVHRTHIKLNDEIYYPLPSHGAHQDPWIYSHYRGWDCAFFLKDYEVKNHIGINVNSRYEYGPQNFTHWIARSRVEMYRKLNTLSSIYRQDHIEERYLLSNLKDSWILPC